MNWEAISAVGELIGALAVLGTLLYLASQVKKADQSARAVVRDSVSQSVIQALRVDLDDLDLSRAAIKLSQGEELTELEMYRHKKGALVWLRTYENVHFQYRNGILDKNEWQAHRRVLMNTFTTEQPGGKFVAQEYDRLPAQFSDAFQELVSNMRKQMKELAPPHD